jgi:hypothetical protein
MSMLSSTAQARAAQEEDLAALAARWPPFSAPELRRLQFLAYRRTTGRLRPPAPLGAAGTQLAAEIAASLHTPVPPAPPRPAAAAVGVPPLWRAWLAAQQLAPRAHRPGDALA